MSNKETIRSHGFRFAYYLVATTIPVLFFATSIFFLLKNLNGQHDFVGKEIRGIAVVDTLVDSMVMIQKVRGITAITLESGAADNGNEVASLKEDFLNNLDRLANSEFVDGSTEILPLRKEAEALFSAVPDRHHFDRYTVLLGRIRGLLTAVSARSNLILDPVQDTYYLVSLSVNRFPKLIEYIGRVRGSGGAMIAAGDPARAVEMKMHLAILESEKEEVDVAVATIFQSSPDLRSSLEPAIKAAQESMDQFVKRSEEIASGTSRGASPKGYFDDGTRAIEAFLAANHKATELLDSRLEGRFSGLKKIKYISALVALLAIAFMVYFIGSFYRENRRAFRQIEQLSVTDELTGLYNRRHFYEIIGRELQRSHRDGDSFALAIVDVDHFKQYNDTYGHQAGDEVLRAIAVEMSNHLKRAGDFLFRLGGEEFCFFFSGESREKAIAVAETIRRSIEGLQITHEKNSAAPFVTVSIGLTYVPRVEGQLYLALLKAADDALYAAKAQGRNRCVLPDAIEA